MNDSISSANEKGMVLVTVLLLIAALIIVGTTAVMQTSTDLKISTNYKTGTEALYAAEAGVEEARARLRKYATSAISDAHPTSDQWRAYIGTDVKAQGKGYDSENVMHVKVASLQSDLDYVVTIRHQTDASGNILYWGDSDSDGVSERNTSTGQNIYLVTSYGSSGGSTKTITTEVARVPPITVPGSLYVEDNTTINGNSTTIVGTDACGTSDKPGIVTTGTADSITANGNPTIEGSPDGITYGSTDLDIQSMIDSIKDAHDFAYTANSVTITGTQIPGPGDGWGTPAAGITQADPTSCNTSNIVYYDTQDTYVKFSGGTAGCGILLVEGDLEISGGFSWYGIVVATGSIRFTGGGDKNVTGAIVTGSSLDAEVDTTIAGGVNIIYCSSAVNNQTQNAPLRVLSWKEGV
jgi:Tfp pilus assembly protein PilX